MAPGRSATRTRVVVGDVALPVLGGERLERVAELPGWKVLVYGNHEQSRRAVCPRKPGAGAGGSRIEASERGRGRDR